MSNDWQNGVCDLVNRHPFISTILMVAVIALMSYITGRLAP